MKCQVSSSLFYLRFPISDSDSHDGFARNVGLFVTDLKPLKISKTKLSIPLLATGKNSKVFVANNINEAKPWQQPYHNTVPVMDILTEIMKIASNEEENQQQDLNFVGTIIGWFENTRNTAKHPPTRDTSFEMCELDVLISDDSRGMVLLKMQVPFVLIEWYKKRWLIMHATIVCTHCEIKQLDLKHSILITEKGDRTKICSMDTFVNGFKQAKQGAASAINQMCSPNQLNQFSQYHIHTNGNLTEYRRYIFESDLLRFQALRENKQHYSLPNVNASIKCDLMSIKNVKFVTPVTQTIQMAPTSDFSMGSSSLNVLTGVFCNSSDAWYVVNAQLNGDQYFPVIIPNSLLSQVKNSENPACNFTYDITYSEVSVTPFLFAHVIKASVANYM